MPNFVPMKEYLVHDLAIISIPNFNATLFNLISSVPTKLLGESLGMHRAPLLSHREKEGNSEQNLDFACKSFPVEYVSCSKDRKLNETILEKPKL